MDAQSSMMARERQEGEKKCVFTRNDSITQILLCVAQLGNRCTHRHFSPFPVGNLIYSFVSFFLFLLAGPSTAPLALLRSLAHLMAFSQFELGANVHPPSIAAQNHFSSPFHEMRHRVDALFRLVPVFLSLSLLSSAFLQRPKEIGDRSSSPLLALFLFSLLLSHWNMTPGICCCSWPRPFRSTR